MTEDELIEVLSEANEDILNGEDQEVAQAFQAIITAITQYLKKTLPKANTMPLTNLHGEISSIMSGSKGRYIRAYNSSPGRRQPDTIMVKDAMLIACIDALMRAENMKLNDALKYVAKKTNDKASRLRRKRTYIRGAERNDDQRNLYDKHFQKLIGDGVDTAASVEIYLMAAAQLK